MSKGPRAFVERMESRQLLASISGLVWNDLNDNGVKETREKWFSLDGTNSASVTLYADLSGNGQLDAGEPSTTVTKEGAYKLNISNLGPIAVRTHYAINPATQKNTAIFGMVPVVVVAAASDNLTNVNVPLQKGGVVTGTFYTDENANGMLDGNETKRGRSLVYFDDNNDGVRENEEPFVPLGGVVGNPDIKYTIPVPLGQGTLRVVRIFETDTLSIDPVTVNAEAGKLYNRDFRIVPEMALSGRLFNDLNGNGKRNKGEPWAAGVRTWFDYNQNNIWDKDTEPSASSDAGGNYRLVNRKSTGLFGINVRFRSTPTVNITSTLKLTRIVFKKLQDSQSYSFGFKPAGINVQMYNDPDGSGTITAGDSPLQYMVAFIDINGNKKQDAGEPSAISGSDGIAKFENLATTPAPKKYTVIVKYSSKFIATSASEIKVTLDPFEQEAINFGVKRKA